jgi:ATPase subunit of ABC transporter with duplicated ATPase domains
MGTLLPTLAGLLTDTYDQQKNTRGEIRFLKAELESMETALLKVSEAPLDQPPDLQVKLWAKEVRELSYEIEDNVDRFLVRLKSRSQKNPHSFMGFIHKSIDLMTKAKIRHKIGTDIKDIRGRIKEVSERRDRYKVDSIVPKPSGVTTDSLRLSALYDNAADLIGIEEKSEVLVQMLKDGDELSEKQLKMVSIAGFGGLGKTTLANVVYQKLKPQFDCCAFVSVSLTPNMKKIFENLLNQLDKKNMNIVKDNWDQEQLIRELREFLKNKRYCLCTISWLGLFFLTYEYFSITL